MLYIYYILQKYNAITRSRVLEYSVPGTCTCRVMSKQRPSATNESETAAAAATKKRQLCIPVLVPLGIVVLYFTLLMCDVGYIFPKTQTAGGVTA